MIVLFQQFPIFIPFQHLHLLNGYLIEFDKTFSLWHSVIDQYGIDILHIREADEFVNGSIITDIPFQLRNSRGLSPRVHKFFCIFRTRVISTEGKRYKKVIRNIKKRNRPKSELMLSGGIVN